MLPSAVLQQCAAGVFDAASSVELQLLLGGGGEGPWLLEGRPQLIPISVKVAVSLLGLTPRSLVGGFLNAPGSVEVTGVSSPDAQFYASIQQPISLLPGRTSLIDAVILPLVIGHQLLQIVVHTSIGDVLLPVEFFAVENPYGLRPIEPAPQAMGHVFRTSIAIRNPKDATVALQIKEAFTTETFLQLEMSGRAWLSPVPPGGVSQLMNVIFEAEKPGLFTGFVHLRFENAKSLVIPVKLQVPEKGGHHEAVAPLSSLGDSLAWTIPFQSMHETCRNFVTERAKVKSPLSNFGGYGDGVDARVPGAVLSGAGECSPVTGSATTLGVANFLPVHMGLIATGLSSQNFIIATNIGPDPVRVAVAGPGASRFARIALVDAGAQETLGSHSSGPFRPDSFRLSRTRISADGALSVETLAVPSPLTPVHSVILPGHVATFSLTVDVAEKAPGGRVVVEGLSLDTPDGPLEVKVSLDELPGSVFFSPAQVSLPPAWPGRPSQASIALSSTASVHVELESLHLQSADEDFTVTTGEDVTLKAYDSSAPAVAVAAGTIEYHPCPGGNTDVWKCMEERGVLPATSLPAASSCWDERVGPEVAASIQQLWDLIGRGAPRLFHAGVIAETSVGTVGGEEFSTASAKFWASASFCVPKIAMASVAGRTGPADESGSHSSECATGDIHSCMGLVAPGSTEVLSPLEVSFPLTHVESVAVRYIRVRNPSEQETHHFQLAAPQSEQSLGRDPGFGHTLASEQSFPRRHPFRLPSGANRAISIPPGGCALLGPIVFQPPSEGDFVANVYIRNSFSRLEPVPVTGVGGVGILDMKEDASSSGPFLSIESHWLWDAAIADAGRCFPLSFIGLGDSSPHECHWAQPAIRRWWIGNQGTADLLVYSIGIRDVGGRGLTVPGGSFWKALPLARSSSPMSSDSCGHEAGSLCPVCSYGGFLVHSCAERGLRQHESSGTGSMRLAPGEGEVLVVSYTPDCSAYAPPIQYLDVLTSAGRTTVPLEAVHVGDLHVCREAKAVSSRHLAATGSRSQQMGFLLVGLSLASLIFYALAKKQRFLREGYQSSDSGAQPVSSNLPDNLSPDWQLIPHHTRRRGRKKRRAPGADSVQPPLELQVPEEREDPTGSEVAGLLPPSNSSTAGGIISSPEPEEKKGGHMATSVQLCENEQQYPTVLPSLLESQPGSDVLYPSLSLCGSPGVIGSHRHQSSSHSSSFQFSNSPRRLSVAPPPGFEQESPLSPLPWRDIPTTEPVVSQPSPGECARQLFGGSPMWNFEPEEIRKQQAPKGV